MNSTIFEQNLNDKSVKLDLPARRVDYWATMIVGWALMAGLGSALAQSLPAAYTAPQNVVQLSASGSVEAQQDLLSLILTATREGADANAIQSQLKAVLDVALIEARKAAQPGELEVHTGNFALYPRYSQSGQISVWQGNAELVLEGRDFPRITRTAGRIQGMTVSSLGFGLSREQRAKVEDQAQAIAIDRFKVKASELAKEFGFSGYGLREVAVNSNDQGFVPQLRSISRSQVSQATMAVPVEAGKSTVTVTVSGTVQLK